MLVNTHIQCFILNSISSVPNWKLVSRITMGKDVSLLTKLNVSLSLQVKEFSMIISKHFVGLVIATLGTLDMIVRHELVI